MLETLLCTRNTLYISYCGRSLKDNAECMPSVLVRELLDFVDLHCQYSPSNDLSMSQQITTIHPMQAFSEANFQFPLQGYSSYWCDIANQLALPKSNLLKSDWSQQALIPVSESTLHSTLDLRHLCRFLKNPIEYFFRQRLKIYLSSDDSTIDEETFDLAGLEKWHLKQRLANDYLNQVETNQQLLSAEGLLPHGPAANSTVTVLMNAQHNLLQQLQPYYSERIEPKSFSLLFDSGIELNGSVENYYPKLGLMEFTSSKLQGKHLLSLWVKHLLMCAANQFNENETSCLFSGDQTLVFSVIDAEQAHQQLADYVDLFEQGTQAPLAIFPVASYAFAKSLNQQGNTEKALGVAIKTWQSSHWGSYSAGDVDNAYVKLALRNNRLDPLTTEQFQVQAQTLYQLALNNGDFS